MAVTAVVSALAAVGVTGSLVGRPLSGGAFVRFYAHGSGAPWASPVPMLASALLAATGLTLVVVALAPGRDDGTALSGDGMSWPGDGTPGRVGGVAGGEADSDAGRGPDGEALARLLDPAAADDPGYRLHGGPQHDGHGRLPDLRAARPGVPSTMVPSERLSARTTRTTSVSSQGGTAPSSSSWRIAVARGRGRSAWTRQYSRPESCTVGRSDSMWTRSASTVFPQGRRPWSSAWSTAMVRAPP